MPNLHLDSRRVTDELAAVLEVIVGSELLLLLRRRLERPPGEPLEGPAERICHSERLCLERHLEILERLAGGERQESELGRELQLLCQAGLLTLGGGAERPVGRSTGAAEASTAWRRPWP